MMSQAEIMLSTYGGALVEEFVDGREFTVLVLQVDDDVTNLYTMTSLTYIL